MKKDKEYVKKRLDYITLDQGGKIQAEYVWIDGFNQLRSKCMTLDKKPNNVSDLSEWYFDGSSTGQAEKHDSDVYLRPVAFYPDPFRQGDNIIVMAECWNADGTPNKFNYRHKCSMLSKKYDKHEPWFGMEQEYVFLDKYNSPYEWPRGGFPAAQGPYYCGVGMGKVSCREIVEIHYRMCLYAGIKISGINAEVMPSQWEFQIGPCKGVSMGDELWIARYILMRISEEFGVKISFHPKPVKEFNGSGCHTNFSSLEMRKEGGIKHILDAISKLKQRHKEHIEVYGEDNALRLTGIHETAHIDDFTHGIADRSASIRIPHICAKQGYGYFEDRRPASNIDPYQVCSIIMETIFSNED
ncbi:hypothetical protein PORY_002140 [Pneumocystis oryctolagi]|uniref:Uncharacterized protein n=1 Tax=Pneumocystis oryctolagi TaxID=42067 RepID=A0ACB7CAD1_9ASCO|nr:hypothetical protein PORY_002140 [Pneumocystis oryctolagi]